LILEELYHQQQLTLTTLRTEHTQTQQLNNVNESLVKEKETALNSRNVWKKEVMKLQMLLKENQAKIQEKDSLIDSMRNLLQLAQDTCKEKIQSVESKYQTIKSINHQLELKILEIKSQSSTGTL
jgi:chromosome segregation ATPase